MKDLERLLKTISDGMRTVAQGVETIAERVDAFAKTQSAVKPARQHSPAKQTKPASPKPSKKRTPAKKKSVTAIDAVYQIISHSKKGVDTVTLKKKTGFDDKKIHNTIYKLKKQGKIKTEKKGHYTQV